MLGGFALAFFGSFPAAFMMAQWKMTRAVLQPFFVVVQCIPMFALAPLMVLWFDWSFFAVVVPTALMIFFPLTMNLYRWLVSTPEHLLDFFRIHRASTFQTFWKLRFPWAIPYLWAGLRISSAIAGIGAVAGEWAGAQVGLGVLMLESRRAAEIDMMFGALFCLTLMSLSFYWFILMIERRRPLLKQSASVVLLIMLSSCHTSDDQKTRIVLDWLPNPNHVPLYAGVAKGFFKKRGIDLEIKKIHDPSDPLPLLISRQTDLAISYSSYVLRAQEKGANIEPIAILIQEPLVSLIYRKDRGIQSIADLDGKALGYCLDGSETRLLTLLLKKNDVKPAELKNLQFDLVGSLAVGRVDGFYGGYWNIEVPQLDKMGIDAGYFSLPELGFPSIYELIVAARSGDRKFSTDAFSQALQESILYCLDHPMDALEYYFEANPDKTDTTKEWEREAWLLTLSALPKSQSFDWDKWNAFKSWMKQHGLLYPARAVKIRDFGLRSFNHEVFSKPKSRILTARAG